MPVLRYFVIAGAGLLALLFVVSAWLPAPVVTERDASGFDKTTIRISGDKPPAERVTIDTSVPTITPPVVPSSAAIPSADAPAVVQDELKDDSGREALARMDDAPPVASPEAAQHAPVRRAAVKKRPRRPVVVMARPMGLFDLW